MLYFQSDYIAGAHPEVMEALCRTNAAPLPGYGTDEFCEAAAEKIRAACEAPSADVHFLTGGTQTNAVVIASLLDATEGVVAAVSGHIGTHEAGAIEYTGHKVLTLPEHAGKLDPAELAAYLADFAADENNEHMVAPGMVYLSHPTEYGTVYSKAELAAISDTCRKHGIPLYLDGARLGYGLAAVGTDLTLPDIAALCDVFYIGGTKIGALCGEAVVFAAGKMPRRFATLTKQHGAMLAKGRLLGVQFHALFSGDLYMRISRRAVALAMRMREILLEKGYTLAIDSPTNQQFPVLSAEKYAALREKVAMSFWEKRADGSVVVRLATGWSTTEADVEALRDVL
ncbi:MAG: aminotransferase class I/II-fold pyridoxal phosphate-dependent enzyme [Clostridia bacterium]|nr:aminotransferase class I/II-fold pyridoxal phosphate-dependent enzyme [Clostridia bacterium]